MADERLRERSPLAGLAAAGRFGNPVGEPGVVIAARPPLDFATIAARRGAEVTLRKLMRDSFGIDLPRGPGFVASGDVTVFGVGPEEWLVSGPAGQPEGLAARIARATQGAASVVDQSHGRIALRVSGLRARETLAKGCAIDLHPGAFRPGSCAMTQIAHMTALVAQADASPAFDLVISATYAGSFWRWLTASAAEYGYLVDGFNALAE